MSKLNNLENISVYKISEGIILYKNVFKDSGDILSFFKKAETYDENVYIMKKFDTWGHHGIWTEIDSDSFHIFRNANTEEEIEQKFILEKIYEGYKLVNKDFMSKYGDKDIWPRHYSKINLFNEGSNAKIAFLKYDANDGQRPTINVNAFHSDVFQQDMDTPGYKLIFTSMIYLNDDYGGGEICFWDGQKIVGYKPEAGDIVVFPSCEPFYHGVLNTYGQDRYAIRVNYCAVTDGSEEFKSRSHDPSLNYTNYKVGYKWIKDGMKYITTPNIKEHISIQPPTILTVNEMERLSLHAKD